MCATVADEHSGLEEAHARARTGEAAGVGALETEAPRPRSGSAAAGARLAIIARAYVLLLERVSVTVKISQTLIYTLHTFEQFTGS